MISGRPLLIILCLYILRSAVIHLEWSVGETSYSLLSDSVTCPSLVSSFHGKEREQQECPSNKHVYSGYVNCFLPLCALKRVHALKLCGFSLCNLYYLEFRLQHFGMCWWSTFLLLKFSEFFESLSCLLWCPLATAFGHPECSQGLRSVDTPLDFCTSLPLCCHVAVVENCLIRRGTSIIICTVFS